VLMKCSAFYTRTIALFLREVLIDRILFARRDTTYSENVGRVGIVVSALDSEPGEPGSNLGACTADA
jgi:hypothetical protein